MIKYMTGCIFEDGYIEALDDLNQKYASNGTVVNEVYGSIRRMKTNIPSARPDFRIPNVDWDYLSKVIAMCRRYNITFNYTMNAPYSGPHGRLKHKIDVMKESIHELVGMGIRKFTVANPLFLEILQDEFNVEIELSTILHINSLHQIKFYADNFSKVTCICMNLYRNRDISFIREFRRMAGEYGIETQIMATEFCTVGGAPCHGIYRAHCYDLHGWDMPKDEARLFGNYPMGRCIYNRGGDKAAWLKSRVIYPNEIEEYSEITGISNFKITTRTAPMDFGLEVLEHYMRKKYDGNLLGLWMQLQTIQGKETKFTDIQGKSEALVDISCDKISNKRAAFDARLNNPWRKFYDKWFMNERFRCDETDCSVCQWCEKWAEIV